jgi:hypothetical protein
MSSLAWGDAPGFVKSRKVTSAESALQACAADFSIPDIPLVEIKPMSAQQLAVFLLKRASAMVFLLRLDVLQRGLDLTRTHREYAITALPEKASIRSVKLFDPFRRRFLYLLD